MGKVSFSLDTIAQLSHFGWGMALVWGLYLTLPAALSHWWGFAVVIAFATVKEGIFDVLFEDVVTRGSGFKDWTFWALGAVVAQLVLLWSTRLF